MNRLEHSFIIVREPAARAPVVVNVPHAGETIPDEIAPTVALPPDRLRYDIDLGVDRLCASAPDHGATLMMTTISRFVVDLNRHPDDLSEVALEEPPRKPPVSYGLRGLIWAETTRGEPVLERALTDAELQARMAYYRPYHKRLNALLSRLKAEFGSAILLDVHSMPSTGPAVKAKGTVQRPDVILGDNLGKACDALLIDPVEDIFRRTGYSVIRNQPYRGGYITRHYGTPRRHVQALQIEVNRKLYMDEETFSYDTTRASVLQSVLNDVFETAAGLVKVGP